MSDNFTVALTALAVKSTKISMSDNTCPICLDTIEETNFCVTDCKHSFCLTCLHTSLLNKESCPLCRNDLVPKNKDREDLARTRKTNRRLAQIRQQQQHQLRDYESNTTCDQNTIASLQNQRDSRDILLDQIYEAVRILSRNSEKVLGPREETFRKIVGIVEGPCFASRRKGMGMYLKAGERDGPCSICGCKTELDDYGDRICFCDSCQHLGCIDEKNEWRREWTKMSLDASKKIKPVKRPYSRMCQRRGAWVWNCTCDCISSEASPLSPYSHSIPHITR